MFMILATIHSSMNDEQFYTHQKYRTNQSNYLPNRTILFTNLRWTSTSVSDVWCVCNF